MSHLSRSSLITKISYLQNFYFTICLIFICTGYISNASSNASPCIKAISQVDPAERAHLEDLTLNTPPPDMLKFPVEYRLHLEHQRAIMTKRSKDFFDEAHTAIAGKIFENNQIFSKI